MEENKQIPESPVQPAPPPVYPPYTYQYPRPPHPEYPMARCEWLLALGTVLFSLLLANGLIAGGLNLSFSVGALGVSACAYRYLCRCGSKPGLYSSAILLLCGAVTAAFARSADAPLKALTVLALPVAVSLGLSLAAGKNRRDPAGASSVLDGFYTLFVLGFGGIDPSLRGARSALHGAGKAGRTVGAVALGLLIAVPLLAVVLQLLISADAAFAGLLGRLPQFELGEAVLTALLGGLLACIFYARTASLLHKKPHVQKAARTRKGLSAVTVNTVLIAVVLVYMVYLLSQTAYFVSGFAGILPQGYTLAAYARRGFFEMAWLAAINLAVIALAMYLAQGAPRLTRWLCLIIGSVTLFLVSTASAKMILYIRQLGLTRLRVLTEVFMLWLGITTLSVCVWLFRPKTAYMKCAIVLALALCAVLLWADVDTVVARYNVRAYQAGQLETVDMEHLSGLGDGAVPYIAELREDPDPDIARAALRIIARRCPQDLDIRSWNWASARANPYLSDKSRESAETD